MMLFLTPSKTRLEARGILPEAFGWYPDKITNNLDAVVVGMHAKADNKELIKGSRLRA